MSIKKKVASNQPTVQKNVTTIDDAKVRIANGPGRKPIVLDYRQGETFEDLFNRAKVWPRRNQIVTYGKKQVRDFQNLVEPGITITIANMPNNG